MPYLVLVWALAVFPWLIAPGRIEPDTKIDLVVSPGRYLLRGVSAWSGHSGFGELQNQAYGYLFPMGAFFELGHVLGVPAWGIQRLWWGLMLVGGGLGAALLARTALHIGGFGACICGLAYALSPRVLTLLAQLSVEAWPGMLLPWFILLVIRHQTGRTTTPRLGVEIAALTVCLGGVNATASLVPLFGAFCYALFTRMPARGLCAFIMGGLMGAAWWLGPLIVLGKYAYPFMDYIETSHITTAVTSAPGVLRGASDWVAYIIDASGHPVWQSGWIIAQDTTSIIGGLLLVGLALRSLAGRTFTPWRALLIVGVLCTASAYVGAVHGPFAPALRDLLDGPLAALRNVHKFDPLIRLPIALATGYAIAQILPAADNSRTQALPRATTKPLIGALTLMALAASMTPFWQGRIGDPGAPSAIPASVAHTARLVDADARRTGGASLILPSSRSAAFTWGTYTDEPLAAYATSPIAYRASAPLVAPGAIRLMDRADADLAAGRDIEPLINTLQEAGIQRIVIRSGTSADQAFDATRDVQGLSSHPALFTEHRTITGGGARFDIFTLRGRPTAPSGPTLGVLGAPESAVTLAAVGVSPHTPLTVGTQRWITDDARKHVYNNGLPAALAYGPTLPATAKDDDTTTDDERIGAKDLTYPGREASLTTMRYLGFDTLRGDSLANPFAAGYLGQGAGPSSALDGSPETAWLTSADHPATLTMGWRHGSRAFTLRLHQTALYGAHLGAPTLNADGHVLVAHEGRWNIPAGTQHLNITPNASPTGVIGITDIQASIPLRAITALPGTIDPASSGVVMTQQLLYGPSGPLRGEDDGTWNRFLTTKASGTMRIALTGANSCQEANLDVNGAPQTLHGCMGEIQLKAGENTLTLRGATRATLTPPSASARAALGLDGGTPEGKIVQTTFSGANAGWQGTVAGHAVPPITIDGWRQGFATTKTPRVHFTPSATNTLALQCGSTLALIALMTAALPWGRRNPTAPNGESLSTSPPAATGGPPTETTTQQDAMIHRQAPLSAVISTLRKNAALLTSIALAVILTGWWSIPLLALTLIVPPHRRPLGAGLALAACGPALAGFGVVAHGSAGAFWGQLLGVWALILMLMTGWREPVSPTVFQDASNSATQPGCSPTA